MIIILQRKVKRAGVSELPLPFAYLVGLDLTSACASEINPTVVETAKTAVHTKTALTN